MGGESHARLLRSRQRLLDDHLHDVPDEVFASVRPYFTDDELAFLTLAAVAINGFNRFNVALRLPAGNYQPGMFAGIAA